MPKKKSTKSREYYSGKVETAYHPRTGTFTIGDKVKVIESDFEGEILSLKHGNFGRGRICAKIALTTGGTINYPLGNLTKQ